MFVVRVTRFDDSPFPIAKDRFANLPLRVGRNPLNDVYLPHNLISSFHARIEEIDGKLCVRDLGSKNGTFVSADERVLPIRINPDSPVDLSTQGYRFFAGSLKIQLEFVAGDAPLRAQAAGHVLGNESVMAGLPAMLSGPPPALGAAMRQPAPALDPQAWPGQGQLPATPQRASSAPPRSHDNRPRTEFYNLGIEAMALQGLRELAASLTPGVPLETTGDVARFITKLHDAVDVFCRCFIPLRDGYAQFVSSLDLREAAFQRSVNRSQASATLESAASPDVVAMALLNARDDTFDAPAAVEGILADLMLHQVALLDGVMQGVKAMLDQLAPENIETDLAARNQLGLLGGGSKARWQEYRTRFERLSDGEQAFSVIFGRQFANAYRQYWQKDRPGEDDQRLRTDRPRG